MAKIEWNLELASRAQRYSVEVEIKDSNVSMVEHIVCANIRLDEAEWAFEPDFFPRMRACSLEGWQGLVSADVRYADCAAERRLYKRALTDKYLEDMRKVDLLD